MSASAQSIQARNTAAANQAAQNLKSNTASNNDKTDGFSNLFASAMSGLNPQAKLSTIQEEMREALNQNSTKKNQLDSDNLAFAGQQQASDAAVWAQRAWVNPAPVQSTAVSNGSAPIQASTSKATQPEQSASPRENSESKAEPTRTEQASTSKDSKPASEQASDKNSTAPADDAKKSASPDSTAAQTNAKADATTNTNGPADQAIENTVALNAADSKGLKAEPSKAETGVADNGKLTANDTKVDLKVTQNSQTQPANLHAAQIARNAAAQAMQVAQQAQVTGRQGQQIELDEKGLQVGDKILATGASASSAAANPAAGLMGLGTTRTGLAGEALIKTPVNQPGFVKELAQQVNWTIGKNMSTVDIRVNPESFGPMNMRLVQKGQEIHLVIRTQDDQSAAMMTQAVHGLKEALAQSGLQLGQVQIHGAAADAQNAFANLQQQAQGQQQAGSGSRQQKGGNGQSDGDSQDIEALPQATTSKANNNGLDLFA